MFANFLKIQLDKLEISKVLKNAYLLAKIGADTAENERNLAKNQTKKINICQKAYMIEGMLLSISKNSIYLQRLVPIQPRTIPPNFGPACLPPSPHSINYVCGSAAGSASGCAAGTGSKGKKPWKKHLGCAAG